MLQSGTKLTYCAMRVPPGFAGGCSRSSTRSRRPSRWTASTPAGGPPAPPAATSLEREPQPPTATGEFTAKLSFAWGGTSGTSMQGGTSVGPSRRVCCCSCHAGRDRARSCLELISPPVPCARHQALQAAAAEEVQAPAGPPAGQQQHQHHQQHQLLLSSRSCNVPEKQVRLQDMLLLG